MNSKNKSVPQNKTINTSNKPINKPTNKTISVKTINKNLNSGPNKSKSSNNAKDSSKTTKTTKVTINNSKTTASNKSTPKSNASTDSTAKPVQRKTNTVMIKSKANSLLKDNTGFKKQVSNNKIIGVKGNDKSKELLSVSDETKKKSSVRTNIIDSQPSLSANTTSPSNVLTSSLESAQQLYPQSHAQSSESIHVEPPSLCESDILDNMTINQIENNESDFDYYYDEDFEDYESDFEEDDDEDENDVNHHNYDHEVNDEESYKFVKTNDLYNINTINDKYVETTKSSLQSKSSDYSLGLQFALTIDDINSADLKIKSNEQTSKTLKRGYELLDIIKLNTLSLNICDVPPINYDVFIRSFGKRNAKQVSCQTCDRVETEIQTDDIDADNKWTQNPSISRIDCGSDAKNNSDNKIISSELATVDPFLLSKFLSRAEIILSSIIDCEYTSEDKIKIPAGSEQFSISYSTLNCIPICEKSPISCMFANSLYLFCVQNESTTDGSVDKSLIAVWNLFSLRKRPEKVLMCRSHITCGVCDDHSSIVIAAMIDGSVALWDTQEEWHHHQELIDDHNNKYVLRTPSYNSAVTGMAHKSAVVAISKISYNESDCDDSFHFATADENGCILIWTVNEAKSDGNDCGVSPISNWRLTLNSTIEALKDVKGVAKVMSMECQPNHFSQLFCGTDSGVVIRCTRHEELDNNLPKLFFRDELIGASDTIVMSIRFNRLVTSVFLVAYNDGIIAYYSTVRERPLIVFDNNNSPIVDLKWLSNRCSTFVVLNSDQELFVWDLIADDMKPIVCYKQLNRKYRLLSFELCHGLDPLLVFGDEGGNCGIHVLSEKLQKLQTQKWSKIKYTK